MVDLPALLKAKQRIDATDRLQDVLATLATNNRGIEDAEYKAFMRNLNKAVGIKAETKFNRSKFEELRAMAASGGNKAK